MGRAFLYGVGGKKGEINQDGYYDVTFYDYDGTIVYAYSKDKFLALTAMPENPSHTGLVAEGWNWTLADAQDFVRDYGALDIGQSYRTASGLTEFDIELTKQSGYTIRCNMAGNKDWGDGTTDALDSHTYADYGKYTITCDGNLIASSNDLFGITATSDNLQARCLAARIGNNVQLGDATNPARFRGCRRLKYITIPTTATLVNMLIAGTCDLKAIIFPQGSTGLGLNLAYCGARAYCAPKTTNTNISNSAASGLKKLIMHASQGSNGIFACNEIHTLIIREGVTTLLQNNQFFPQKIKYIKMPSSLTSMRGDFLPTGQVNCIFDFRNSTSVVSLSQSFSNPYGNIVVVPDSLYSTWRSATNWVSAQNIIYKASEVQL